MGPEAVQTGAGPVATRHVRLITALSGQSQGGAVRDLWLDRDGLVVKEDRGSARSPSVFVGLLTYEERASFLLTGRPSVSGRLFQRWRVRGGAEDGTDRPAARGQRHQEAILDAARRAFAEHGYQHATIRMVADLAGVDPALVHPYFRYKQDLFVAAVQLPVNPVEQLGRARPGPGPGRASGWSSCSCRSGTAADQSPLLALVRSAVGDERAAALLREFITEEVLGQIAHRLGGPDARSAPP